MLTVVSIIICVSSLQFLTPLAEQSRLVQ